MLDINADAAVRFTLQLEKIGNSALVKAVRAALNGAALHVKQKSMPKEAAEEFEHRNPSFFKASSRVDFAKGSSLDRMQSTVGFTDNPLSKQRAGYSQSIEDLEQQEHGGSIGGRTFVPMDTARSGGSSKRRVKPNLRLAQMKMVDAKNAPGSSDGQKFIQSVFHAGKGGFVVGNAFVWKVNSLNRTAEGKLKLTAVYSKKKGRNVGVKATHFMQNASETSAKEIEGIYIKEAERQINKLR